MGLETVSPATGDTEIGQPGYIVRLLRSPLSLLSPKGCLNINLLKNLYHQNNSSYLWKSLVVSSLMERFNPWAMPPTSLPFICGENVPKRKSALWEF